MHVRSDIPNAKVKVYDTVYELPAKVRLQRSREKLQMTLLADTLVRTYTIRPSVSPTFLYLNLVGMQLAPLNYAVDYTNDKRFYYGRKLGLNMRDSVFEIDTPIRKRCSGFASRKYERNAGDWRINVSVPYINTFLMRPKGIGTVKNTGFWGLSLGADYFYRPHKFLNARVAAATDFFVPFPAAVSQDDISEDMTTMFAEVSDNFKFGRLSLGYGLNYSSNKWSYSDTSDPENSISLSRRSNAFGISANAYFQLSKSFYAGCLYRPTLLRISPIAEVRYEHLISVEAMFKIPTSKKSSKK